MATHYVIPDVVKDRAVLCMAPNGSVLEGAQELAKENVAAVCIVDDGGSLVGIVTERDMTQRVLAEGKDPAATKLSEIMTDSPETLAPSDTAMDALQLMHNNNFRHLPVVDEGKVLAMVSIRDLYAVVNEELSEDLKNIEAFAFGERYGG